MEFKQKILAIETSCDETAAAVLVGEDGKLEIESNVIASQIDLHQKYGGVYPEVASRAHAEQIIPVIEEALKKSGVGSREFGVEEAMKGIDAVAVTNGPGLIGSLVIGIAAAKTLAYAFDKPIIPINHWEGHLYSVFLGNKQPQFPALFLTVSGGHTSLILMKDHGDYEILGQTLDDSAGEAFDKVARLLGLGYPGGPEIAKAAIKCQISNVKFQIKSKAQMTKFQFPRPMTDRAGFDFSFSGLKTAVLYKVREMGELDDIMRAELAYEFQEAITDTLIIKARQAINKYKPKSICLTGGVSANKVLRGKFEEMASEFEWKPTVHIPPLHLTTDNAVMIGAAGYYHLLQKKISGWYDVNVDAGAVLRNWP